MGKEQVSLSELRHAVAGIYRERASLAEALKGSRTVVAQVGRVIGIMVHLMFILFYLLVWGVSAWRACVRARVRA